MSFATDKWFQHIRGGLLTEGLADIGLDEMIQKEIEAKMPEASEKGRMWVGAAWKALDGKRISNYGWFEGFLRSAIMERAKAFQVGENNILLNLVSVYTTQPVGKWPKAKRKFARNSLRLKVPNRDISQTILDLKVLEERTWRWFSSRIENVIITLNQNPNNYDMIKTIPPSDYTAAEEVCFDYQQTREDPDQIMHVFDDGSYWYDLDTYQCEMEGNRMGHCGRDERGTLYSLRKKESGQKSSKSYVTIAYNTHDETIYQIKGRQNTCPPRELWNHIATFIEITGAEKLAETGEYSNEPEEFEELGQWLDENAGISFEGSFEKRMQEFREEVERLENDWERSEYFQQVDFDGVSFDTMDGYDGDTPMWAASVSSIASKLPFDLSEEAMRTFFAVGSEDPQDLALSDEIEEAIMEIFEEEDRNDIIKDAHHYSQAYAYLLKADNYAQAFIKADNMSRLMREDREQLTKGSDTYVVIWDIGRLFEDHAQGQFDNTDADAFGEWYEAVNEMVDDLDDSLDAIEDLLVSRKLAKRPDLKGYADRAEEEFNNFIVATSTKAKRGTIELFASGILFKATEEQMQALKQVGFNRSLFRQDNGSYWGYELRREFLDTVFNYDRQAQAFAKNQMKLNFGEKYKEIPDDTFDKAFEIIEQDAQIGITTTPAGKGTPPSINYKITIVMDKNTFPVLGPYIEYYDNHFDVMIKGFERGVRAEVKKAEEVYQQRTGSDTNLPVEEARANPLDVRLYEIDFVMSYPLGKGFEITDIHNIVRAIPDVTTVRTVGNKKRSQGNRSISLQRLKFALQGQIPREQWVKQVLLPQVRKISPEIRIHKVERADMISNSQQRLEETFGYFNSTQRQTPGRATPAPSIQGLIDDWVEGGVMYDAPTSLNLTRYSVMMPVADLEHLCGREPRKHGHHFDAGYENFIQNGPRDPIYLAIGKNGRAKITGNEDDLRYAIKAGVEEVPVFISYQRQV
jgi:hypothetical protein